MPSSYPKHLNPLVEHIAELLHQRMELGKSARPVPLTAKKTWTDQFKTYLYKHVSTADIRTRVFSSNYFALLSQLEKAWKWVDRAIDTTLTEQERLYRLDAFFDLMERLMLEAEKQTTRQRQIFKTKRGLFILGTRPLLVNMAPSDERTPLVVDRPYRRFFLLPNSPVNVEQEIIDGSRYPDSMQRLNGVELSIGLAAMSGRAITHFKPTNQLSPIGTNARIGFVSASMQPNTDYVRELQDCLDWAITQKIHILCLPELSVCLDGRQVLKDHISRRNQEKPLEHLTIVVAGSYHADDFNEAPVWLIGYNGQIEEFRYRKREALETRLPDEKKAPMSLQTLVEFAKDQKLSQCYMREDISSDNAVLLLNLPIGVVGVIICKDFLNPEYYAVYNAFEPDYLLIVSMNSKSGEFMQTWRKYPRRHALTAGFYVNATQVVNPNDNQTEVAFWGLPQDDEQADDPKDRKSRMYFRQPNTEQNNYEQLPVHGWVEVPPLPASPANYDTAAFLPRISEN